MLARKVDVYIMATVRDKGIPAELDIDALLDAGWRDYCDATGGHDQTLALAHDFDGLAGCPDLARTPVLESYPYDRCVCPPAPNDQATAPSTRGLGVASPITDVSQVVHTLSGISLNDVFLDSNQSMVCASHAPPDVDMDPTSTLSHAREIHAATRYSDCHVSPTPSHSVFELSSPVHLLRQVGSSLQSQKRLPIFLDAWMWILHREHPTIDLGYQILRDLERFAHLEHSVDLWCYTTSATELPPRPLDLMQYVQCDLDALAELPEAAVIADQRMLPGSRLTSGTAARAALSACSPVAFDVPHESWSGMRSAPDACIPHYVVVGVDHTVVAGSGALLAPRRSTGSMPTVLHVVLGQVVLIHLPLTHANEGGPPDKRSLRHQFLWALYQPSAVFRILYPGESAFIPAMHWHAMIALGYSGSSFSATVVISVGRAEDA
ncbi:hypothetical protein AURDEDRAFT_172518 [Auricularia subglabra TFB-10046 SS5]|nr:hypothetical protein AURDEDRAFT_172518 [Auricularia subglabra TFB-10046 SS5]